MAKERIEPTTYWLGNTKKFQALARVRTQDLLAGKAISEVHFTPRSGDKVEFFQNLFKKRVTDHDFLPIFMWTENNNLVIDRLIELSEANEDWLEFGG